MIHTILAHPGGAHKDDLLAARSGAPIVRRVPTPEELDDPGVAVVDIGGVHDPARSNSDHHHGTLGRLRRSFPEARDQSELRYCRRGTPAAFEFGPGPSYTPGAILAREFS
jgi:uncharacterized UPF0160 family protein